MGFELCISFNDKQLYMRMSGKLCVCVVWVVCACVGIDFVFGVLVSWVGSVHGV